MNIAMQNLYLYIYNIDLIVLFISLELYQCDQDFFTSRLKVSRNRVPTVAANGCIQRRKQLGESSVIF